MFLADLHIHSKYSRATSRDCVPEALEYAARRKGLDVIGTGDFTHAAWREELREKLLPAEEGLYRLKSEFRLHSECDSKSPRFLVTGEISSIYKKNGKVRKVHNLLLLPGLEAADKLAGRLEQIGNLHSDGRPILGLDSKNLLEIMLETCPEAVLIPAHIWTPHFSLFGAYSGFDTVEECFEDLTPYIPALETGLSSNPPMNWMWSSLDAYTLVSHSDAHSPANLAREANLFQTEQSYPAIVDALRDRESDKFFGTLEFFPEEGKYHCDGHRHCSVCLQPEETRESGGRCPVCGGRITVGVLHRVMELSDRPEGFRPHNAKHFESLVPLPEVVAASTGFSSASWKTQSQVDSLIREIGPELYILREAPLDEIQRQAGPCVAEGIRRLRLGELSVSPGYDGEYGKVTILTPAERETLAGQLSFIPGDCPPPEKKKRRQPQAAPIKEKLPDGPIQKTTFETQYGLNQEQWQAVTAQESAIAVIAGPGTGKTRTLVYRIIYLIEQCGVPPAHITAVTFTNKAAREMRERLQAHFSDKRTVKKITIGTFHSICLHLLSQRGRKPILLDEFTARALAKEVIQRTKLSHWSANDLLLEISRIKNGLPADGKELPKEIVEAYRAELEKYGACDFDDLLLEALRTSQETAESCFSYLLVDEFQDSNDIQLQLIRAWARDSKSVFVIGDPDQSIYGFRGSQAQCFAQFQALFTPVRTVSLLHNYRSTPEIIGSAVSVISSGRTPEHRLLEPHKDPGQKVRLLEADTAFAEALFVAKEINRLVGGLGMLEAQTRTKQSATKQDAIYGFSDLAILYRTHRQADVLEQCLIQEGIPYRIAGKDDFLSEPLVRKTLAFFRCLSNPADTVSLLHLVLAESPESLPSLQRLLAEYRKGEQMYSSLLELAEQILPRHPISLWENLQRYEPLVKRDKPGKLMERWITENGYEADSSMDRLYHTAVSYETLTDFLQNLMLGQEGDVVRSGSKTYASDAVSLMTLHGSKGLEFPVVFLCGLTDGLLPFHREGMPCEEAEERRLFYVGMTRAQEELYLLTGSPPSPFLPDLPDSFVESGAVRRYSSGCKQLSLWDLLS